MEIKGTPAGLWIAGGCKTACCQGVLQREFAHMPAPKHSMKLGLNSGLYSNCFPESVGCRQFRHQSTIHPRHLGIAHDICLVRVDTEQSQDGVDHGTDMMAAMTPPVKLPMHQTHTGFLNQGRNAHDTPILFLSTSHMRSRSSSCMHALSDEVNGQLISVSLIHNLNKSMSACSAYPDPSQMLV